MWKKHKKELVLCIVAPIAIVLALLIMVILFERLNIHVIGSREMWIGFIGAVIGGAFTLLGVLITIYKQEDTEMENKRLSNMPILGFEVCYDGSFADGVVTYTGEELITSGFKLYEEKQFATIRIRTANNTSAFNFRPEECMVNGKEVSIGDAFNPACERIAPGENISWAFDCWNINTNVFVIMRFSYEDIFGNKYYQDLPFIYSESAALVENKKRRQIIDIRDLKQPQFENGSVEKLCEAVEKYQDYSVFCVDQTRHSDV